MSLKEYIVCLFVCAIANIANIQIIKTHFLFLGYFSSGENCVWSLWFLFITESLDTSGKILL